MKTLTLLLLIALPLSACLEGADEPTTWKVQENGSQNNANQNNQNHNNQNHNNQNQNNTVLPTDPKTSPILRGEFLGGHLGNYLECPEQGYSGEARSAEAPGLWAGDCAEDSCGILNCEGAQITFSLRNEGEVSASNLRVTSIELFDAQGVKVADLPVESVIDANSQEPMTRLGGLSEATYYLFYQGPAQPWDILDSGDRSWGQGGTLIFTVDADNHPPVQIETPMIYVLDAIAT